MLYQKPKDVKYVDMCVWIDENAYDENCDRQKLFEYLYHIAGMLAYKRQFFKKGKLYDDFAVYAASRTYARYTDINQFVCKNGRDKPKLQKIKSVLNYLKKTIYPMKVTFEQTQYAQNIKPDAVVEYNLDYDFKSHVRQTVDSLRVVEYTAYMRDIVSTIKDFVKTSVYASDKKTWNNIYLSCLLSFLNGVTLSNKAKEKLKSLQNVKQSVINKLYKYERDNEVILYHLDDSFRDYIKVLVNQIRHIVASDMSHILNTDIYTEASMEDILVFMMD